MVKALLFIIVLLYLYETYTDLIKLNNNYDKNYN